MSTDQRPIELRKPAQRPPFDVDLGDGDLLDFALGFAGERRTAASVARLIAEFGGVEAILAAEDDDLRRRGRLSTRAVAILKLLHAFRSDSRRGRLLH